MKRGIAISLTLLLLLAGCGNRVVAAEAAQPAGATTARTVLGKIKEINGNEILLALAKEDARQTPSGGPDDTSQGASDERPSTQGPGAEAPEPAQAEAPDAEDVRRSQTDQSEDPDMGGSSSTRSAAGATPNKDASGGQDPGGEAPAAGGRGNRQNGRGGAGTVSVTLTGEEQTFLLPVTANVTSGEGENARTIRFTQLAVKNVIRICLDENDNILSVQVLS